MWCQRPPRALIVVPVMAAAFGEQRMEMISAIWSVVTHWEPSSPGMEARFAGVVMDLGVMALSVILDPFTSWATSIVSRETEAFETA